MIKEVRFYETAEDERLKFAVILARSEGKWVFCRHRERTTLEIPGGHREPGESVEQAAARELREETGAEEFTLRPVCVYSVVRDDPPSETYGELHSEIEEIFLLEESPKDNWTYPDIQPELLKEAVRRQVGYDPLRGEMYRA